MRGRGRCTAPRLLFRSVCPTGAEKDRVLVRSIWRAEVELLPWEPRFEIAYRRVVPATELLSHLRVEKGFEPIYYRAIAEARLISRDAPG
jgi:hypothetical protein